MKNTLLFLLAFLPFIIFAQPPGGRSGGGRPQIELADNTGAFMGRVSDAETEEAIFLVNVVVFVAGTDSLVTGTTSNARGVFVVQDLPYGSYDLEISYLGYADQRLEDLRINPEQRVVRAGRVLLEAGGAKLDEIEVTAERAAVQFGLDRKVFNVEDDIATVGGTAEDLLRNIPSVTVDLDGNISLRGSSNIRILINGKPSALTGMNRQAVLQQLAANNIESIEVLTNPSAKYNAEGMGGIINIITKQQNRQGFNLQVSATVGTNDKYNGNLGLNYRVGKFNVYTNYSYQNDNRWFRGQRLRSTITADSIWTQDQLFDGNRMRLNHTVRGGIEYFVNSRGSINLSGSYSDRSGSDLSERSNTFLSANDQFLFSSNRTELGEEDEYNQGLRLDYDQRFRAKGRSLSFTTRYNESNEDEIERFSEVFRNDFSDLLLESQQQNPQLQYNDQWLWQVDYAHPLSDKMKLETGSRINFRNLNIDNRLLDFDTLAQAFVVNDIQSNRFDFQENVYAGYVILEGTWDDQWEWQAGLRAEQTNTTATLLEPTVEAFPNNYFSLFPSGFVTYNMTEATGLQLSYSRRINRPRFRTLNPFIDFGDPLNPRGGNPYLLPEFINSFEFNYLRSAERGSFTLGVYLREVNNMITRISRPDPETGVNLRTFANLATGRNYGLEMVATYRPISKLMFVINGNGYRNVIDGNDGETELNAAGYQFSGRLQSTYTLGEDWNIQLTGFYRSPGVRPQGRMRAMGSIDFGFTKSILRKKGALTFRVSDLFNTRKFGFQTETPIFLSDALYQRESRIAYIGFTYSLRQDKNSRRDRRDREEGGDVDF